VNISSVISAIFIVANLQVVPYAKFSVSSPKARLLEKVFGQLMALRVEVPSGPWGEAVGVMP